MASPRPQQSPRLELHKEEKNLICGICQDVYTAPRLLSCFHTFCTQCLERLVMIHACSFPCPTCRKPISVPEEGATGFQSNMYITHSELDRARKNSSLCRVHVNFDEPLTLFCLTCDEAICLRCKLTKHEGHQCEDLVRGAECDRRLAGVKRRLDVVVDKVETDLDRIEVNLREVKRKRTALKEQVHSQYDSLVIMAGRWRDRAVKDIDKRSEDIQLSLSSEKSHQAFELEAFKSQRTRVLHTLDKLADDSCSTVDAEKVLRSCASTERLGELSVKASTPLVRPGLDCRLNSIKEEEFQCFIGKPFTLVLPSSERTARETITRFFRCTEGGSPRQIHALCVTGDNIVHCMYGDSTPDCSHWGRKSIGPNGQVLADSKVSQKFVFRKFSNGRKHCITHHQVHSSLWVNAKSGNLAQVRYMASSVGDGNTGSRCALYEVMVTDSFLLQQPKLDNVRFVQTISAAKPVAMDATANRNMVAVLEEVHMTHEEVPTRGHVAASPSRVVRLYRRGQENHVATYAPPQPASFFPTDVCFWRGGNGKEKLLVADFTSDSVHVLGVHMVNARKWCCRFERSLAAGCGDLVKPTALDTDPQGRLWIGCSSGWILKCQAVPGAAGEDNDSDIDVGYVLQEDSCSEKEENTEGKFASGRLGATKDQLECRQSKKRGVIWIDSSEESDAILIDSSKESDA